MSQCEFSEACPFFQGKMDINQGLGAMFRKNYCENKYTECARYMVRVKKGKGSVPENLYPNMVDRVNDLLEES